MEFPNAPFDDDGDTEDRQSVAHASTLSMHAGQHGCLNVIPPSGHHGDKTETNIAAVSHAHPSSPRASGADCVTVEQLLAAAERGQVERVGHIVQTLLSDGKTSGARRMNCPIVFDFPPFPIDARVTGVCNQLAERGEVPALRTLVEAGCVKHMNCHTLLAATKGRSAECIRYLAHQLGVPALRDAVSLALRTRNLEALKLLFDARPPGYDDPENPVVWRTVWTNMALEATAHSGYTEVVEFALTHGGGGFALLMAYPAAAQGHAAILRLAVAHGARLTRDTVLAAIQSHSLECLQIAV